MLKAVKIFVKHTCLCLALYLMSVSVGIAQQQQGDDTTEQHPHNMTSPDFTDMGIGSLISAGRYKLSNSQFESMIVAPLENILSSPMGTFTAQKPDPCMPPVHCGWDGSTAPPAVDWNVLDSNLRIALTNTSASVKSQIVAKVRSVWMTSRPNPYPAVPMALTCEFVGLNSPAATPSATGMFTSVTLEKIPVGASNPQVVRIRLVYQP